MLNIDANTVVARSENSSGTQIFKLLEAGVDERFDAKDNIVFGDLTELEQQVLLSYKVFVDGDELDIDMLNDFAMLLAVMQHKDFASIAHLLDENYEASSDDAAEELDEYVNSDEGDTAYEDVRSAYTHFKICALSDC